MIFRPKPTLPWTRTHDTLVCLRCKTSLANGEPFWLVYNPGVDLAQVKCLTCASRSANDVAFGICATTLPERALTLSIPAPESAERDDAGGHQPLREADLAGIV